MNIKVFSFNKPYFSFWNVPTDKIEPEIESWLLRNPKVKIFEIKHDLAQGIWFAPQLIVTIYYSQADDKSWLVEPNARANGPEQPSLTLAINGIYTPYEYGTHVYWGRRNWWIAIPLLIGVYFYQSRFLSFFEIRRCRRCSNWKPSVSGRHFAYCWPLEFCLAQAVVWNSFRENVGAQL